MYHNPFVSYYISSNIPSQVTSYSKSITYREPKTIQQWELIFQNSYIISFTWMWILPFYRREPKFTKETFLFFGLWIFFKNKIIKNQGQQNQRDKWLNKKYRNKFEIGYSNGSTSLGIIPQSTFQFHNSNTFQINT